MRNEAPETCAWCKGSGYSETESLWDLAGARMKCPVCNGQGSILVIQPAKMCSTCNGSGRVSGFLGAESKCLICGGSGWAFAKHEEDQEANKFEQEAKIRTQNREIEYKRQIQNIEEIAALRRQREYEDGQRRAELDSLTQQKQNSVTELLSKADYYSSNNLKNDALKCLEEALTIDPRNSKAWIKKGLILEYLQKKDEALRCYVEAIWINPNDRDAWIGKGRLSKDPKDSVECRNRIAELDAAFYDTRDGNDLPPSVKAYLNQIEQANKYPNKIKGDLGTSQVNVTATSVKNSETEDSSWFKKGAKFIGLSILVVILGAIFYFASQNPELKFIELSSIPGFKNTDISNTPSTYTSDVVNTYIVKISYNGRWSGYTQSGSGDSEKRPISGVGTKTIENKLTKWPVIADIKKDDGGSGILTVQIWNKNKKIKTDSTDNLRTRVRISAYG